jgi:hypothetical protein
VSGSADADRFGQSVAVIGDLNSVAGQEFAVGAPQVKMDTMAARGATGPGYVQVFDHSGVALAPTLSGTQQVITGVSDGEAFGMSVAGGFDYGGNPVTGDPDGFNEILVGAILYDRDFGDPNPMANAGAVHVFSGADFTRLLAGTSVGEGTLAFRRRGRSQLRLLGIGRGQHRRY